MLFEKCVKFEVVEFFAIIVLDSENGKIKVSSDKGMESNECSKYIRFLMDGDAPNIMRKIINNNEIVTKTRETRYWGCP